MTITHYDLFAGIGGFSLALEEVFTDATIKHIFCEWESFPTSVLKQHWPDGKFYGDIADLVTHTERQGLQRSQRPGTPGEGTRTPRPVAEFPGNEFTIVTGGFPCQPFSQAGRRKGTADDRYQWPNMFEVIRNTSPEWVIAENVRGLVTWNDGLVLETVCADLEAEGYEVQPFIIPAVAVGAPHRRDRVWIIANRSSTTSRVDEPNTSGQERQSTEFTQREVVRPRNGATSTKRSEAGSGATTANTRPQRRQSGSSESLRPSRLQPEQPNRQYPDWQRNWQEVAFATCNDAVDDGLSRLVDGVPYSRAKWRQHSLKAYGNGIVSQVAMQIMEAIKETY